MLLEQELVSILEHLEPARWQRESATRAVEASLRSLVSSGDERETVCALARLLARTHETMETMADAEAFQLAHDCVAGRGFYRADAEAEILNRFWAYMNVSEKLAAFRQAAEEYGRLAQSHESVKTRLEALLAQTPQTQPVREEIRALRQKSLELTVRKTFASASGLEEGEYRRILEARDRRRALCRAREEDRTFEKAYDAMPPRSGAPAEAREAAPASRAPAPADRAPSAGLALLESEIRQLKERMAAAAASPPPQAEGPGGRQEIKTEMEALRRDLRELAQRKGTPASPEEIEAAVRRMMSEMAPAPAGRPQTQPILPAPAKKKDPRGGIIEI